MIGRWCPPRTDRLAFKRDGGGAAYDVTRRETPQNKNESLDLRSSIHLIEGYWGA
jgi:hypothetical protein